MSHAPAGLRRAAHDGRGHFQIGLSQLKLLFLDVARGARVRSLRRANGFAYRKQCERVRRVSNEKPKVTALGEFLTRLRAMNCRRWSMRRASYAPAARARCSRSGGDRLEDRRLGAAVRVRFLKRSDDISLTDIAKNNQRPKLQPRYSSCAASARRNRGLQSTGW